MHIKNTERRTYYINSDSSLPEIYIKKSVYIERLSDVIKVIESLRLGDNVEVLIPESGINIDLSNKSTSLCFSITKETGIKTPTGELLSDRLYNLSDSGYSLTLNYSPEVKIYTGNNSIHSSIFLCLLKGFFDLLEAEQFLNITVEVNTKKQKNIEFYQKLLEMLNSMSVRQGYKNTLYPFQVLLLIDHLYEGLVDKSLKIKADKSASIFSYDIENIEIERLFCTVKEFFLNLLLTLWREKERFSGKRPFGESDWELTIYEALAKKGAIKAELDQDGYIKDIEEEEREKASILIEQMLNNIFM